VLAILKGTGITGRLHVTGVGLYHQDANEPSRIPKLTEISKHGPEVANDFHVERPTPQNVFENTENIPTILDFSLLASAVVGPAVVKVQEGFDLEASRKGIILNFINDFVSRHPSYVTGIHPLYAILRVLYHTEWEDCSDDLILGQAFCFIDLLLVIGVSQVPT
jgi:hypothetical protein